MEYYISEGGQRIGPLQESELIARGITANTQVWCAGMATWAPACQVPSLAHIFYSQPAGSAYQQPYAPPYLQAPLPPKSWMVEAILVTLFCCLPLGIVGIVKASNASSRYAAGDYQGAEQASREAGKWTKWGFFLSLAGIALYLLIIVGVSIIMMTVSFSGNHSL